MYLDKQNNYSENQTLAAGVSTNIIDHATKGDAYEALWLGVTVVPALGPGQSIAVEVQTSDVENFAAPVVLATFNSISDAQFGLAIGQRLPRPQKRYSRLRYTLTGSPTGTVTAFLTPDIPTR